jgi:tRNA-splicing ligase RtcB (3'-phosphate/5'-hydroxy nucleic acid ligase)
MAKERYEGLVEQVDRWRWRLPRDAGRGMRAEGMVYASEALFAKLREDAALWQVANVACMPGIVGPSLAMPDCHYGYGFPIGGVAAFDVDEGVISPGGVGYDINCGVRLLRTSLTEEQVRPRLAELTNQVFRDVPSGVGEHGGIPLQEADLDGVLSKGAGWVVAKGYGRPADLEATEERGCLAGADPGALSDRARKRGRPQLATLGSGNHFLELQVVERVYDEAAARAMGLDEPGQVTVMIHCGSRGLGHQVCDDAIEVMRRAVQAYGIQVPDPQLSCVPVGSPEGQRYFAAMAAAANYAWANRQAIMHQVRAAFERVLRMGEAKLGMDLVWDVAHNIAKFEEHTVDGRSRRLCVHRKGATRAFGPGRPELPARYRDLGQPVIVPGDMGTGSYVLLGTAEAMAQTWGSTCHGAGRALSRHAALKLQPGHEVARKLEAQGIVVRSADKRTLAEEAPEAYKDVDDVVETCACAGISRRVARLRPIAVMKG